MSRFLIALALGFSALAASATAQAQPDRYLFVPDRSPCCQQVIRDPLIRPNPVTRIVERRMYVTPPPNVQLSPVPHSSSRVALGLVTGVRRRVLQTAGGMGVVAGARITGDFGWSSFGLRFDFTHFAEEDEYRTAFEWRFIARQHEMFRPYASFAPGFTAARGSAGTRFGFGVESELGLLMNHDTTHGALQITLGATGSAGYLPAVRRSLVDVGVRASLGFAFD
ncbi:MAG: hypothetical protein ACI9KE_003529 [Polyangiales bacterium]|jgi:hypothetical protein